MTPQQRLDCEQMPAPNIDHLVLEDDTPVDWLCGKQQRLLVEPLYSAKALPKPFRGRAEIRPKKCNMRLQLFTCSGFRKQII
jgi:hypothetical protein